MAKHERILLLGPTGVDKRQAVERLSVHLREKHGLSLTYIDFEKDFLNSRLPASGSWTNFLWQQPADQHRVWREAWDRLRQDLKRKSGVIVLGLHATYVSAMVGLRCPIDIPAIAKDFRPSLIVNLIDDIYSAWRRTEERAAGREDRGRPTFEQLLVARRAEQFTGDIILTHGKNPGARHVLYASNNTITGLANLIVADAKITYLSFPISEPREMEAKGDLSFRDLINDLHHLAYKVMRENVARTFVSPLSIDELPFVRAEGQSGEMLQFDCVSDRWQTDGLWGEHDATLVPAPAGAFDFPDKQIREASGVIATDVGWRDRRLVLQAKSLAILCPKPPGKDRITRGVKEEVDLAVTQGIACIWWQPPDWDSNDYVGTTVWPAAGSMGIGQTQQRRGAGPGRHGGLGGAVDPARQMARGFLHPGGRGSAAAGL